MLPLFCDRIPANAKVNAKPDNTAVVNPFCLIAAAAIHHIAASILPWIERTQILKIIWKQNRKALLISLFLVQFMFVKVNACGCTIIIASKFPTSGNHIPGEASDDAAC